MFQSSAAAEAADCLSLADEFEGRPERTLLLRLAEAFQSLADVPDTGPEVDDRAYLPFETDG